MLNLVTGSVEFSVVIGVALAAILLNTLDSRGFLASVGVGLAIVYGGGASWFFIVAVFFILGVVFTLYKYGYKRRLGSAQEKGGARNWPNILANGGAASVFAVFNFFSPSPLLAGLFLGAVSTSAADTAATELGLLSRSRPRLVTNLRKSVTPGTSGGVSFLGALAAVLASVVIGLMALFLGVLTIGLSVMVVCVVGGIFGAFFDSYLGATVQRRGHCAICLKPTEALNHCGEATRLTGGIGFIENNLVNLLATVAGALVSMLVVLAVMPAV
ncbi:MAG: DUF92 domain-containing protein [Thaumarchaeota archaeon]|nr:DUF92 domain-containing protein [Nitrososphaerota archaeon]